MTKEVFIKKMAENGNIKFCEAEKYINLFINTLKEAIKEDGVVKFVGLGKFYVKECKEKMARNPKTGEPMRVPKHKKIKFLVSESFNDSLNADNHMTE